MLCSLPLLPFLLECVLAPARVLAQVPRVEHLVIVGVDGLSPDGVRKAKTPNLGRMMKEGAYTLHARGVMPTVSSPNWASMISGLEDAGIADRTVVLVTSDHGGVSNTVMIGEDAGRPVGYNHNRQIYVQYGAPVDGVLNSTDGGGGAWADPFAYAHLKGATADGIRGDGICLINCTSNNEIYSFHPGGANMLFADGSVHFIKESANPLTIVALITRAGGEIISADQS